MAHPSETARREALRLFIQRVRRLCVDLGEPAANVVQITDAQELLALYADLIEKRDNERKAIKRLMEEAPGPTAAA